MKQPGIVVLCCDGLYQRYLVARIAEEFSLLGVVMQIDPAARGSFLSRIARYLDPVEFWRYLFARYDAYRNDKSLEAVYSKLFYNQSKHSAIPEFCPVVTVDNVNDTESVEFVRDLAPDLVCVNGTRLLRQVMLDLIPSIPHGIINLHTGLSPYARGGNCNLFALLEGHPEWVGVTIHHIDPGIDSGEIILTRQVAMEPDDSYQVIDARTFHTGIELMLRAITLLVDGHAQRVKQWTGGKLFLRRTGYVYKPYLVYRVNKLIRRGLLREYLRRKAEIDADVRLVKEKT